MQRSVDEMSKVAENLPWPDLAGPPVFLDRIHRGISFGGWMVGFISFRMARCLTANHQPKRSKTHISGKPGPLSQKYPEMDLI